MKKYIKMLVVAVVLGLVGESHAVMNILTWQDNSGNNPAVNDQELGFNIYRQIDGGVFTVIVVGPANIVTYSEDIAQGTTDKQVCYRVTAFNEAGESAPSNTACKLIPRLPWVIPVSPTNLLAQ